MSSGYLKADFARAGPALALAMLLTAAAGQDLTLQAQYSRSVSSVERVCLRGGSVTLLSRHSPSNSKDCQDDHGKRCKRVVVERSKQAVDDVRVRQLVLFHGCSTGRVAMELSLSCSLKCRNETTKGGLSRTRKR